MWTHPQSGSIRIAVASEETPLYAYQLVEVEHQTMFNHDHSQNYIQKHPFALIIDLYINYVCMWDAKWQNERIEAIKIMC